MRRFGKTEAWWVGYLVTDILCVFSQKKMQEADKSTTVYMWCQYTIMHHPVASSCNANHWYCRHLPTMEDCGSGSGGCRCSCANLEHVWGIERMQASWSRFKFGLNLGSMLAWLPLQRGCCKADNRLGTGVFCNSPPRWFLQLSLVSFGNMSLVFFAMGDKCFWNGWLGAAGVA